MPIIRGNDVITINGKQIAAQGAANLRTGIGVEEAATKTRGNGMDEMVIGYTNAEGKQEKLLIWGDQLDFTFRNQRSIPEIEVNGQRGMLLHFEDESNGIGERFVQGLKGGIRDAMDSVQTAAKKTVDNLPVAGAASFMGGAIIVAGAKFAGLDLIKAAAAYVVPNIATGVLVTLAGAAAFIVIAALVKAIAGNGTETQMGTIAGCIDDNPRWNQNRPRRDNDQPSFPPAHPNQSGAQPGVGVRPIRVQ